MKIIFAFLTLCLLTSPLQATSDLPTTQDQSRPLTSKRFVEAFTKADIEEMKKFFAEEVAFVGEYRFIGLQEPINKPVVISREKLTASYSELFKKVGEEKWKKLTESFNVVTEDLKKEGAYGGIGEVGDRVIRIKGGLDDLDEAIIFIYRENNDGIEITGHFADY
ncbi:MAG: hypothetical protein PF795_11965 [Kiritimatiellae bacterium]|jgi:hypothetical protein|nr:hypothetical protein [Kiritimatiellia bacterium]